MVKEGRTSEGIEQNERSPVRWFGVARLAHGLLCAPQGLGLAAAREQVAL